MYRYQLQTQHTVLQSLNVEYTFSVHGFFFSVVYQISDLMMITYKEVKKTILLKRCFLTWTKISNKPHFRLQFKIWKVTSFKKMAYMPIEPQYILKYIHEKENVFNYTSILRSFSFFAFVDKGAWAALRWFAGGRMELCAVVPRPHDVIVKVRVMAAYPDRLTTRIHLFEVRDLFLCGRVF